MRRAALHTTLSALLLAGVAATPGPAAGQNVVLDQGTFTLLVDGREVGTETFTIRRTGSGDDARILSNAVVEVDPGADLAPMRPMLEAGGDRVPMAYQNQITGDGETQVTVTRGDRRFVAVIRAPSGEREREFRATAGAMFLEGTVAHQYYFLEPGATEGATFNVIVPRSGEQVQARVTSASTQNVSIGGEQTSARRIVMDVGGEERRVWLDDDGNVLRLEIPARNFRAERQSV